MTSRDGRKVETVGIEPTEDSCRLDPVGVSAAAKALAAAESWAGPWLEPDDDDRATAEACIAAYLAVAGSPRTAGRRYTIRVCEGCGTDRVQLAHGYCADNECRDEAGRKYPMREIEVVPLAAAGSPADDRPAPDLYSESWRAKKDGWSGRVVPLRIAQRAVAAASPADERLREALERANDDLILIADESPEGVGESIDSVRAAIKDALAAADREKPEAP